MSQTSECTHEKFWTLKDGRKKCCACKKRFTRHRATSAWDSCKLGDSDIKGLVNAFAHEVSIYEHMSKQYPRKVSTKAGERLYRLIRACCANWAKLPKRYDESIFPASSGEGQILVLKIIKRRWEIILPVPLSKRPEKRAIKMVTPGKLYFDKKGRAFGGVLFSKGYVKIKEEDVASSESDLSDEASEFWRFLIKALYRYRAIPKNLIHLYLGEISVRYYYRHESVFELYYNISELLRKTPINKARDFLDTSRTNL